MNKKQKVDTVIALISILIGVIVLLMPLFGMTNIKILSIGIFSSYAILSIIQFILTRSSKDYEGIHSALASIVILLAHIFWDPSSSPKVLAMFIMAWVILMAITKLKKADYYHDRKDRMWKYSAFNLGLFILTGIIASINLGYNVETQILVLGFFILINGILELFEPVTKTLIAHK